MAEIIRKVMFETSYGQTIKVDFSELPSPLRRKINKEVQKHLPLNRVTTLEHITEPKEI